MGMVINHNIAALDAWRQLGQTNQALNKSLEKLSSGFKINRAADNPAGLVISEQMRAQIAGLTQAIENTETATSMVQTAEAALSTIHGMLDKMRQLAIHAANEGANDSTMLAADQADIENAINSITRIANTTQFGTKKLLDGSRENVVAITTGNTSQVTVGESTLATGTHTLVASKVSDASATISTTQYGLDLASTPNISNLEGGFHTVQVTQASAGATKTGSSDIRITDAFGNGLTFAGSAAAASITGDISGSGTVTFGIQFQGDSGSVVSATINVSLSAGASTADAISALNSAISGSSLNGHVHFSATGSGMALKTDNAGSNNSVKIVTVTGTATIASFAASASDRGDADNSAVFTMKLDGGTATAVNITTGTYTTISALVNAVQSALDTAFGANSFTVAQDGTNNRITITTLDEGSSATLQVTNTSTDNELGLSQDSAAITGTDALVSFDNYTNTISDIRYASDQTVTLYNGSGSSAGHADFVAKAINSQGSGQDFISVGTMTLNVTAAQFNVTIDGGPSTSVTAGVETTVYNSQHDAYVKVTYALDSGGGTETLNVSDQSLVFQVGANKDQTVKISIQSMKAADLGQNVEGNMFDNLAQINVTSTEGAQDAIEIIDKAIDEVSHARDILGAFQKNTLEETQKSLKIANQNLTAAESLIRDTDFALEMSVFTKNQILLQSGTAMLAQANMVPQIVLQLLR